MKNFVNFKNFKKKIGKTARGGHSSQKSSQSPKVKSDVESSSSRNSGQRGHSNGDREMNNQATQERLERERDIQMHSRVRQQRGDRKNVFLHLSI